MSQSAFISIAADGLSAQIDPLGAQLSVLRDAEGRDLLWDGDPAFWASRAPVLFPIVGALNDGAYRVDGQTYRLPRHGLARTRRFAVVEYTASRAILRLEWDEETLAIYPFRFRLDLVFEVAGAALTITAHIANLDTRPMPASLGFHPAFRWPLPYGAARAAHKIRFAQAEGADVRRIDAQGLVRPQTYPSPVAGRDLALDDALFVNDALIFDTLHSDTLVYGADDGPALHVGLHGAPYLGLWTKPGAPFVCIEPWHGIADPEGFSGEFRDKPGLFEVAPGGARAISLSVRLEGLAD